MKKSCSYKVTGPALSPAGHTFALKLRDILVLDHLNQDFEDLGGSSNVPLHICFHPPSTLFAPSSSPPVWALWRALQCHRYDRSTLSAQEIPLFVCSPPKGVKLSSWQLTRPLVLFFFLSLSLSRAHCLFPFLPTPVHLHPQTSENQYQIAWGPLFGVGLTPRCLPPSSASFITCSSVFNFHPDPSPN